MTQFPQIPTDGEWHTVSAITIAPDLPPVVHIDGEPQVFYAGRALTADEVRAVRDAYASAPLTLAP